MISVASTAAPGNVTLAFRATGSGVTDKTVAYALTIPAPAITVSAGSGTASAVQGGSATLPITVTRANGATGNVTLAVEGVPANVTAAFSPSVIPDGSTTSTLTLTVRANAAVGSFPLTVRASSPGATDQTATVQLTVTVSPGGNVSWPFCDPRRRPLWLAFRDGTSGAWTRVTAGAVATYAFTIAQPLAAVAYVPPDGLGSEVQVYLDTRAGLQAQATRKCIANPPEGKLLNGSVAGLGATDEASIFLGGALKTAAQSRPNYQLVDVAAGSQDLLAVRTQTTTTPYSMTLNRMFLQRNVDVANGGTLPLVDFRNWRTRATRRALESAFSYRLNAGFCCGRTTSCATLR